MSQTVSGQFDETQKEIVHVIVACQISRVHRQAKVYESIRQPGIRSVILCGEVNPYQISPTAAMYATMIVCVDMYETSIDRRFEPSLLRSFIVCKNQNCIPQSSLPNI